MPSCPRATKRDETPPALDATLVVDAPRVRSGAELPVTLVLTNPTGQPLPVQVYQGCATFELGAYDRRGQRVDYVVADCGFGMGCGGFTRVITLEPGGTITKHLRFRARVVKVSSKSNCEDADAGALAPGKYELRATSHLSGWVGGPLAGNKEPSVSIALEVTK